MRTDTHDEVKSFFSKFYERPSNTAENVKGKAIPLQVWTGPESSRRLKLPDFMTIGT